MVFSLSFLLFFSTSDSQFYEFPFSQQTNCESSKMQALRIYWNKVWILICGSRISPNVCVRAVVVVPWQTKCETFEKKQSSRGTLRHFAPNVARTFGRTVCCSLILSSTIIIRTVIIRKCSLLLFVILVNKDCNFLLLGGEIDREWSYGTPVSWMDGLETHITRIDQQIASFLKLQVL